MGNLLLRSIGTHHTDVGGFLANWDLGHRDEPHGVAASEDVTAALREAIDFRCVGIPPLVTFAASAEFTVFRKGARVGVERIAMESSMLVKNNINDVSRLVTLASARGPSVR